MGRAVAEEQGGASANKLAVAGVEGGTSANESTVAWDRGASDGLVSVARVAAWDAREASRVVADGKVKRSLDRVSVGDGGRGVGDIVMSPVSRCGTVQWLLKGIVAIEVSSDEILMVVDLKSRN